ncbi:MAG: agmatine deiminase family protein [Methanobacteriota archaeon]|nr:MAG: agmatine deiminase family protein [Euryarchaeota archaeon]
MGGKFSSFDKDAAVPEILAAKVNMRRYVAPMILEGGAISVDGEGTLLTTESCLLNPNRNPDLTREEVENVMKSFLGVHKILWLKQGIHESMIDGHVDGVAGFARSAVAVASPRSVHTKSGLAYDE